MTNPEDLRKLEFGSFGEQALSAGDEPVEAIVKVKRPGYVPPGLKLRSRVDEEMFTASFPSSLLPVLNDDPDVEAVSLSKALRSPGPRHPGPDPNPEG